MKDPNLDNLEIGIEILSSIADIVPEDHPAYAGICNDLGGYLLLRLKSDHAYAEGGVDADINDAVKWSYYAIMNTADDDPRLPGRLYNRAALFSHIYELRGFEPDFMQSIAITSSAMQISNDPAFQVMACALVVEMLIVHYNRTYDPDDLDRAIALGDHGLTHDAIASSSLGSAEDMILLDALTKSYYMRFRRKGEEADLERGTLLATRVLQTTPSGDSARAKRLNAVAQLLLETFWQHAQFDEIAEAFQLHNRPCLASLEIIESNFQESQLAVLCQAIDMCEEGLAQSICGPADALNLRHTLSTAYWYRFLLLADHADLDQAIDIADKVATLVSSASEMSARADHANLGILLFARDAPGDCERAAEETFAALDEREQEFGTLSGDAAVLGYNFVHVQVSDVAVACSLRAARQAELTKQYEAATAWRARGLFAAEGHKSRLLTAMMGIDWTQAQDEQLRELGMTISALLQQASEADTSDNRMVHAELDRRIREYYRLTYARKLSVSEMQLCLGRITVLYFYPMVDRLAILHIGQNFIQHEEVLVTRAELDEWSEELKIANSVPDSDTRAEVDVIVDRTCAKFSKRVSEAFAGLLGDPPDHVPGCEEQVPNLVIVPGGELHIWPLHLLPWGQGLLWDYYAISYAPSLAALAHCIRRVPRQGRGALIAPAPPGALIGSYVDAAVAKSQGFEIFVGKHAQLNTIGKTLGPLTLAGHAGQEDYQVLFEMADGVKVRWNELLEQIVARPPAERGALWCCQAYEEPLGEEILGPTRAMLGVGFRSLTTTLWPIADLPAAYLSCRCRTLELLGSGAAAALRHAALELRAGGSEQIIQWLSNLANDAGLRENERTLCANLAWCLQHWPSSEVERRHLTSITWDDSDDSLEMACQIVKHWRTRLASLSDTTEAGAAKLPSVPMTAWGAAVLIGAPTGTEAIAADRSVSVALHVYSPKASRWTPFVNPGTS